MAPETTRFFELVAAMEDDLDGLRDGADAVIAVASGHGMKDVAWCGEHLRQHVDAAYTQRKVLFAESAAMRRAMKTEAATVRGDRVGAL